MSFPSLYNPCHGGNHVDMAGVHVHAEAAAVAAGGGGATSTTTHASCRGCASQTRLRRRAVAYVTVAAAVAVGALAVFLLYEACELRPRYSVAIHSFQCVDYAGGSSAGPMTVENNCEPLMLTVRVASRSLMHVACTGPGTYVEVSYRGVTLATSDSLPTMCAGPWRATDRTVTATVGGGRWLASQLRRPLLDSLAADVQSSGVQVLDLTLKIERDRRQGTVSVPCGGRVVGDDHALDTECTG